MEQKSAHIVFLENIELELLDKLLFEVELERDNMEMAKILLHGPLKSVAVRRNLEKIAGNIRNKNHN